MYSYQSNGQATLSFTYSLPSTIYFLGVNANATFFVALTLDKKLNIFYEHQCPS